MQGVRPPLSGRSAALGIVVIAFAVAWLRVGGRKDVLGVAKKTRAQVAAAGTKADSRREGHAGVQGQVARNGETAGAHKANAPGDRQSWWLPALDEENLSGREQLTKRIFTTVEVVLCLVLVGTVAVLSMSGNGLSAEGLQATFAENPAASIMLIARACLQPFAAYLLRFVYRHYAQGDTGYAVWKPSRFCAPRCSCKTSWGSPVWPCCSGARGGVAPRALASGVHIAASAGCSSISPVPSWCWRSPVSASSRARALARSGRQAPWARLRIWNSREVSRR